MTGEDKPSGLIKAGTELVKAIPVYQDAIQPAAKQVGKALETVGQAVNVALAPVRALVWGAERLQEFIETKVAKKLEEVPPEEIITPKPNIAGPALESLRYNGAEESLHDLYANLLAAAMDKRTANGVLPSYVDILKQLSSDEAKLLKLLATPRRAFPILHIHAETIDEQNNATGKQLAARSLSSLGAEAGLSFPEMTAVYLDSLSRLGLIEFFDDLTLYTKPGIYDALEQSQQAKELVALINRTPKRRASIQRSGLEVTALGQSFIRACLVDHAAKSSQTSGEARRSASPSASSGD